ncbi:MAG: PTS sugar transporter subunit IIB [Lactobacillus sp.]|uniref:PTS sugar transporter subunit IIB n=1 Tax=Lactobacillus sp. TaxID=1591 RepID=UPI0023BBFD8B|nr:PTS sugar transporter subunit IIB [Lactobacillus sp.]MDE7050065.1 PTS sugar transporter subunit IIB [Lactobacillus sp.]
MKKILLSCAGGFSTSLLVNRMKEAAKAEGKEYEIKAVAAAQVEDIIEKDAPDCILIGPQIKYMEDQLKSDANKHHIPLEAIGMQDYGTMNGKNVIAQAERLLG